ncbi:MAG: hypothetical protein PHU51_03285 [Candidatus Nanoarchaeia archaeon]|nr:hypothetical protein [Candidatus Nanoarchaeia archaeon]
MKKDTNNNYFFIAIVAIVAIVGMTFMAMNVGSKYSSQDATYAISEAEGDLAGQAVKSVATKLPRETIPTPIDPVEENVPFTSYYFNKYQGMSYSVYLALGSYIYVGSVENPINSPFSNSGIQCLYDTGNFFYDSSSNSDVYDVSYDSRLSNSYSNYLNGEIENVNVKCHSYAQGNLIDSQEVNIKDFPIFENVEILYAEDINKYYLNVKAFSPVLINNFYYIYTDFNTQISMYKDVEVNSYNVGGKLYPLENMTSEGQYYIWISLNSNQNPTPNKSLGLSTITSFWYEPTDMKSFETKILDGKSYTVIPLKFKDTVTEQELKEISERIMES